MLCDRRVLLSMESFSKVVSVAPLPLKLSLEWLCLTLWSLCKLVVAMVNPVLLHEDRWAQDQAFGGAVAAQDQALELFPDLNQRLRESPRSAMSWTGSGNIRLQGQ